jgi:Pentose-5-phosphate-3-epimerase
MVDISVSLHPILKTDKENFIKELYDIETSKAEYIHIDIMDGKFVPSETKEMMELARTTKCISNIPLDVHIMVKNVYESLDEYLSIEPNILTFHIEAIESKTEVEKVITKIKNSGVKVGIAISPNTKIEEIFPYLKIIHMVLIMTVIPGASGQKLISETIEKVRELDLYLKKNNLEVDIEVDGGITTENVGLLKDAGANIIVIGSAFFKSENRVDTIRILKKI